MTRTSALHVSADSALLERCAYHLFTRAARPLDDPRRRARFRDAALNPERLDASSNLDAIVPFAARLWLSYLFWLEGALELLNPNLFADITAAEGAGLAALARARARFLGEHSICPRCHSPNPRSAARCHRCSQEFSS